MPAVKLCDIPEEEILPGHRVRFVHGSTMTVAYWSIASGASIPAHDHPHEQIASILSGRYQLTIGDDTRILEGGSTAVIPPNVTHSGIALTDCRVIDVFHPVREDYLSRG